MMSGETNREPDVGKVENPYAASLVESDAASDVERNAYERDRLNALAWIALIGCFVSFACWVYVLLVSLPNGDPDAPPVSEVVRYLGMFLVLSGVGFVGALSMLQRNHYKLSFLGAICLVVPLVGPCLGLTLPIGIWMLILLRRPAIRAAYAAGAAKAPSEPGDVEEELAVAYRHKQQGEWDAAVALYRSAAARSPESAKYIENCLEEIAKLRAEE